ncbi:hypothetical protein OOZ19_21560 [Saccharopolyspora sp. NFXS83]|uniref:hypothetical protein n=1 Tax=Saccharopolyspora sp. NFXS83 TaxID=2993560 RepID=UPI00224B6AE8|nr:hypothetical protein [Saccharopolyspora sp. NFXS83]MCX2732833.1 hypothetical protein [Saccharopolyspora sp. NFXS83]
MVDVAEGAGPVERLHNLLLALTGRVDDDAVNSVREMLGIGQLDSAAEFLIGCLLAGRIPVTSTEQYHLRRALDESGSPHAPADRLHVVETVQDEGHRFSENHEADRSDHELVDAIAPIAGRLHGVRALWCTWRTTPAGVTYGAVPRRVLLAEVGADGSVTAAGYQLLEALRRAGVGCSVDVFSSGMDLPPYHRNALATARRVHLDLVAQVAIPNGSSNHARAPRATAGSKPGGGDVPSEPVAGPGRRVEAPVPDSVSLDSARPERARPEPVRPEPPRAEHRPEHREAKARPEPARPAPRPEPAPEQLSPEPVRETAVAEAPEQGAEPTLRQRPVNQEDLQAPDAEQAKSGEQAQQQGGGKNTRVPAAVDAKLTDRERNLLRKLHEELAQREQDRGGSGEQQQAQPVANGAGGAQVQGQDAWNTTMPGGSATGGFPPIDAKPR